MKLFCVGQTVNRAAQRNLHQIPINFGIADWWGYTGKVKKASDIAPFDPEVRADCQYKGQYVVYPEDVEVPAGIKAEQFNVIDADAPGGSGLGSAVQFESVTNSSNMPSWYVNFNAWKFRQDWPSGNASRNGMLVDDQQNILEPMLDQMRDRMYDSQRQDVFYRNERGDLAWTRKDTLPYEQWSPISADHKYLNATGRQLMAEMDEEWMLDKITTGHSHVPGGIFAPWIRFRTYFTMKKVAAKVNNAILRSQF